MNLVFDIETNESLIRSLRRLLNDWVYYFFEDINIYRLRYDFINPFLPSLLYKFFLDMPSAGNYHRLRYLVVIVEFSDFLCKFVAILDGHADVGYYKTINMLSVVISFFDLCDGFESVVGAITQVAKTLDANTVQGQLHTNHVEWLVINYHNALGLHELWFLTWIYLIIQIILLGLVIR